jgi:hypothetical protein
VNPVGYSGSGLEADGILELFEAGLGLLELGFELGAIQGGTSSFGSSISSMALLACFSTFSPRLTMSAYSLSAFLRRAASSLSTFLYCSCIWSKAMP